MMRVGLLTGGGDVPGLNSVVRDITYRATREKGIEVIGIKRGWGGLIYLDPVNSKMDSQHAIKLDEGIVRKIDREGGTFLHTSRVLPSKVKAHPDLQKYRGISFSDSMDMTDDVLQNLTNLGIDVLTVVGGDDTLSYARFLHGKGIAVIGIPKTMDGDVAGTDYCIGFSTAITRASQFITELRSSIGSHERFGIVEIFGRNSGFTALYTAFAAKPDRVVIPEVEFDKERLLNLLIEDRINNPSDYSIVVISEGAKPIGEKEVLRKNRGTDPYGHEKLGGVGEKFADFVRDKTHREVVEERLGYLLRSGQPVAKDKIVASAFANIAMDAILRKDFGKLTSVRDGKYCVVPLEETAASPRKVDVERFYNSERYRPNYKNLEGAVCF